jgi:hypothetical protein
MEGEGGWREREKHTIHATYQREYTVLTTTDRYSQRERKLFYYFIFFHLTIFVFYFIRQWLYSLRQTSE